MKKELYCKFLKDHNYSLFQYNKEDVNFLIILNLYQKQGYTLSEDFVEFLSFFADKKLKYRSDREPKEIDLSSKKVLKDYPKWLINGISKQHNLKDIIPIAETDDGYMLIAKDSDNYIYGIYDQLVILYGKELIQGLENILKGKEMKRISE